MHLDCCKIVIEDISSGEGWAGNKAPKFVMFTRADQLNVNPFLKVLHRLLKDTVVHQLYRFFCKPLAAFFRSSVFIFMYGSIQGLCSNFKAL